MNYSNILLTIAEISGVLIGFANLASVLEKSNEDEVLRQLNKIRLLIITEGGILTIFACLVPFLLTAFNYSEVMAFRIASVFFACTCIVNAVFNLKRGSRLTGIPILVQISARPSQKTIGSVMLFILFLMEIPLILISVGYFNDGPIAGWYCLCVLLSFLSSSIFLIRFLRQVIS